MTAYEFLELELNDYDNYPKTVEYFWDVGYKHILDYLDDFDDEDYEILIKSLDTRSNWWKSLLIYCLVEIDDPNPYEIEMIDRLKEYY